MVSLPAPDHKVLCIIHPLPVKQLLCCPFSAARHSKMNPFDISTSCHVDNNNSDLLWINRLVISNIMKLNLTVCYFKLYFWLLVCLVPRLLIQAFLIFHHLYSMRWVWLLLSGLLSPDQEDSLWQFIWYLLPGNAFSSVPPVAVALLQIQHNMLRHVWSWSSLITAVPVTNLESTDWTAWTLL